MSDVYKTPDAGLVDEVENTSGMGKGSAVPDAVKGWCWGGFLLTWIWSIGNRTWIGLLTFVPYIGFIVAIVLGVKGREWAWQNKRWESVEHFNRVQRAWSLWGLALIVVGLLLALGIPAYVEYTDRATLG